MTPSEKKYIQRVGKLYWSVNRSSLVLIESLSKREYNNKWKYTLYYLDTKVSPQNREIDCVKIGKFLRMGTWRTAEQHINNSP